MTRPDHGRPRPRFEREYPSISHKTKNDVIFPKLWLGGATVTADDLAKPFDLFVAAGRAYDQLTYHRKDQPQE